MDVVGDLLQFDDIQEVRFVRFFVQGGV